MRHSRESGSHPGRPQESRGVKLKEIGYEKTNLDGFDLMIGQHMPHCYWLDKVYTRTNDTGSQTTKFNDVSDVAGPLLPT